ncbi:MAG: PKD domain-containing protein [Ginsengibacter sp.]
MKRIFFIVFFSSICSCVSFASHITGGEIIYEYLGPGNQANTRKYRITLKLFRDEHTTGAAMPQEVLIGIFNNDNNSQYPAFNLPYPARKNPEEPVSVNPYPPCVNNAPDLDYHVGYFPLVVDLPNNNKGYTATYQTCCRVNPLINVFNTNGVNGTGSTYSCSIPSVIDNSPQFVTSIDLICMKREFTLNFSAFDNDGDSLAYAFAQAYDGGAATNANNINPQPPNYRSISYINGFRSEEPLGSEVTINPKTGAISGIAPGPGKYVVCVAVRSYKNGKYIAEHRKDFIVNVGDCDFAGAELAPKPVTCDGFEVNFFNSNTSLLNKTFYWDFGDPESGVLNTSTLANPTHQFSDTGVYMYKLVVNPGLPCSDSTTQIVKVYPGFYPGFTSTGQCKNTPIQFRDTTSTKYGVVNTWSWNFADPQNLGDSSHLKNPSHIFAISQEYAVQLIVTSSKGCIDTAIVPVIIKDRPDFAVTNDTLICSIDTLQLTAIGTGNFFWTPDYSINNQSIPSPLVSPDIPTKYYVTFSDPYGCKGGDSVFVDVKSSVTLNAGADTSTCLTDPIILNPVGDALHYKWSPSATLNTDTLKNPTAIPLGNTTYFLIASIGKCQASDAINIKVTPYPQAKASNDSIICRGDSAQLYSAGGSIYRWSPVFYLSNPDIANPIANPKNDIRYIVKVSDTLGCPKAVSDSVIIKVFNVTADAGPGDTSIVADQPLQLTATGGEFYIWTPAIGLSNAGSYNPVARLSNNQQYVVKAIAAGCFDTDTINVKVYKIEPGLYVPNAFTPGNDGINDVFRPLPIGMKSITYFRVFNRWGLLMYSSTKSEKGWDGTYKGKPQDPGVYVWMVEGIDYLDKRITRKGSVVLIR